MFEIVKEKLPKKEDMFSKKYLVPVLLGAVAIGTVSLAGSVDAHGQSDVLVKKLAEKFGIEESKVQAVFDEERTVMEKERQAEHEAALQKLVDEGKLTATQRDALIKKHQEMHINREANKDAMQRKTGAERQAEHEARRAEMDKWLAEQGIDKSVLEGLMGPGKGGMGRGHHNMAK